MTEAARGNGYGHLHASLPASGASPVGVRTNRALFLGFYLAILEAALARRGDSTGCYFRCVHLHHVLQVPSGEATNVRVHRWLERGDECAWVTAESVSRSSGDGGIFAEPEDATVRIHGCIRARMPSAQTDQAVRQRLTAPEGGVPPCAAPTLLAESFDHQLGGETILALTGRFESRESAVDAKEAWVSKGRALLRVGAPGDGGHVAALSACLWEASILACEVAWIAEGRVSVGVVDCLEDVAVDESGAPCDEYWVYAVVEGDERAGDRGAEETDASMSRRSWADVWAFTPAGRVVARMRQRLVRIHDLDFRDTAQWIEPRASALLLRLWQLDDRRLRRVVRSLLLSTMAFAGAMDVMSLDTRALIDHRSASALQHRILSVLGVPVVSKTRSTYETFFESVSGSLSAARPDESRQRELLGSAALRSLPAGPSVAPSSSHRAWVKGRDVPGTGVRLLCLPYGSGNAESYSSWQVELEPGEIEVRPIQMPGRAERRDESPVERADEFLRLFADAIRPLLFDGKPYALYGQSMGGALAYSWLRYAEERALPLPIHVFVGGFPAFHVREHWYQSTSTPFQLSAISGMESPRHSEMTPLAVRAVAEMLALTGWVRRGQLWQCADPAELTPFLPRILADHGLVQECVERYSTFRLLPTGVGLTVFHAEHDDRVRSAEALAWTEVGAVPGQARLFLLRGQDHFFCDSEAGRRLAFDGIRSVLGRRGSKHTASSKRANGLSP